MTSATVSRNQLDRETSPYLLQHRDNPVHWQPWGREALAAAKAADKPVLLSVGYAACHWCHVMAHESFEDPDTAGLMNQLFVNIKVDREERPDIDSIYQSALALLGEQGGWPLTMFLTPDGEPFWGGTYFPPSPRYGRPGFPDVLRRVAEVYRSDPATIEKNRTALMEALGKLYRADGGQAPALSLPLLDQIAQRLLREVDPMHGGIGSAPKFPQTYVLELLWRAWLRSGATMFRDAVTLSLDHMCQGGIYDHLGGGFARYSTDERWLVPHFEKMLYDNALLIDLLTLVYPATGSRLYAARVRETVEWVLREMVTEDGGFAATLDADSDGEEGRFYVWTEAEIDRLLGPDSALFKAHYDVSAEGNWEGKVILNRSDRPELLDEAGEAELARLRRVLLAARGERVRPGWDDKVLADWNGLMIAALANAGNQFGEADWIAAAQRAYRFVRERMAVDGRLCHAWRDGQLKHSGLLDDYANMARAALALREATGDDGYRDHAEAWVGVLDAHYWDDQGGGYFYTADDAEALITRVRSAADHAVPSGNGIMVRVLAELHLLTGDGRWRDRAERVVAGFAPELARNFFPLATLLNNFELLANPTQVAIVGARQETATEALIRAAYGVSLPNRVLQVVAPGEPLPDSHPAAGKPKVSGKATAYVCVGQTCSLPVTDPAALREVLPQP